MTNLSHSTIRDIRLNATRTYHCCCPQTLWFDNSCDLATQYQNLRRIGGCSRHERHMLKHCRPEHRHAACLEPPTCCHQEGKSPSRRKFHDTQKSGSWTHKVDSTTQNQQITFCDKVPVKSFQYAVNTKQRQPTLKCNTTHLLHIVHKKEPSVHSLGKHLLSWDNIGAGTSGTPGTTASTQK